MNPTGLRSLVRLGNALNMPDRGAIAALLSPESSSCKRTANARRLWSVGSRDQLHFGVACFPPVESAHGSDAGPAGEACSSCGAEDWQVQEFGPLERVLCWLQFGRPAPRASLTCRQCGSQLLAHGGRRWAVYRARRYRAFWWGAPVRIVRVLLHARTAIPVPIIYVGAAAVGTILGIILDLTVGWPWWAGALGSVAGVWVLFLLTAFKAAGRRMPESLWGQLLDALSPKAAVDRSRRREERVFRDPPFPFYGLPPSWEGPRFLGGMGWGGMGREAGVNRLELAHGDPEDPRGMELRVSSSVARGEPDLPQELLLRQLAESLWHEVQRPPPDLPAERFHAWAEARERERRRRETPPFSHVEVPVDGEPTRFAYLAEQSSSVAQGRSGHVTITLRARNLDVGQVELVSVRDVEPYIEGSRRLQERWRNHH